MATKSAKEMTINFTDVDVSRLSFTDLEENQRSKGQKIAYPRYDHPQNGADTPLFIQFPWVALDSYGIPKLGEFYSEDSQRLFVKIPLDQSNSEVHKFSNLLKELDAKLGSDEFKEKMFGAKASKYEYQPIYREPQEEDESVKKDPSKKDYGPKHPYMKLKIDTTYPDNKIKSIVFNSVMENGKRVRTKVEGISTIDDMASHVCWKSRIRPIGRPVKLWAQAPNKKDPTYGITFKMAKTEVEPPSKTTSNVKQFLESDAFLDSDGEESDTHETAVTSKPTQKATVSAPTQKGKQVAQVESDDSEEESDEEEVVKPVTKSAASTKKVVDVESEDESEEEEEVKPAKKAPAKAPAKATASKSKKAAA